MSALAGSQQSRLDVLTVDEARAVIGRALGGPGAQPQIIVDFDETLWLRNTTEEYLNSLRPRFLALAILLVIDAVRPWTFLRHKDARLLYRDWIRAAACTVLMPWSLVLWRRGAGERARRWRNGTLIEWLGREGRRPLQVATLGLDVLVRPILEHIDPTAELIAAGSLWSGYRIRQLGKNAWIDARHAGMVSDAVVITDSEHDADILAGAGTPVLVKWPDAEYRPAFAESYLPFLYTQRAKRPGENYMLYGFLLEDMVHLWLAFAWIMAQPLIGAIALLLMHLGFFAVYELGYQENDVLAVRHEAKPTLKAQAAAYVDRVKPLLAWLAALALSLPGLALLWRFDPASLTTTAWGLDPARSFAVLCAAWIAYLVFQRASFWIYNRLDTNSRSLAYVVLQVVRLSGYAVLLRVNLVGAAILLSLVLARWVKYIVYRDMGRTLAESQRVLMLAFFVIIASSLLSVDTTAFFSLQAGVALVWLAIYSHQRVRQIGRGIKLHRN